MRAETSFLVVQCIAYFIIGTATATILGYIADEAKLRSWIPNSAEMAFPSAISFATIGVALILINRHRHGRK